MSTNDHMKQLGPRLWWGMVARAPMDLQHWIVRVSGGVNTK